MIAARKGKLWYRVDPDDGARRSARARDTVNTPNGLMLGADPAVGPTRP
jgi:hypothetical protein